MKPIQWKVFTKLHWNYHFFRVWVLTLHLMMESQNKSVPRQHTLHELWCSTCPIVICSSEESAKPFPLFKIFTVFFPSVPLLFFHCGIHSAMFLGAMFLWHSNVPSQSPAHIRMCRTSKKTSGSTDAEFSWFAWNVTQQWETWKVASINQFL